MTKPDQSATRFGRHNGMAVGAPLPGAGEEMRTPIHQMLAFARALAAAPDRELIGKRLSAGHGPDQEGRCLHSTHRAHPETHQCSILRVVTLVDRLTATEPTTESAGEAL